MISIWPSQKLIQQILRFLMIKQNLIFHIIGEDIENFSNSFHQPKFSDLIRRWGRHYWLDASETCLNIFCMETRYQLNICYLLHIHLLFDWNIFKGFLVWSWQTIFPRIQSTVQTFNWENKKNYFHKSYFLLYLHEES